MPHTAQLMVIETVALCQGKYRLSSLPRQFQNIITQVEQCYSTTVLHYFNTTLMKYYITEFLKSATVWLQKKFRYCAIFVFLNAKMQQQHKLGKFLLVLMVFESIFNAQNFPTEILVAQKKFFRKSATFLHN